MTDDDKKNTRAAMDNMRVEIEAITHKYGSIIDGAYRAASLELRAQGMTRERLLLGITGLTPEAVADRDYILGRGFDPKMMLQYLPPTKPFVGPQKPQSNAFNLATQGVAVPQ